MNDHNDDDQHKGRGFASMTKAKVKELGSKGGKASHRNDPPKTVWESHKDSSSSSVDIVEEDEEGI